MGMRKCAGILSLALAVSCMLFILFTACFRSNDYPPLERERISFSNHGRYFPLNAGSAHDRADCADCHGGTATFHDFTCIRCHEHAIARMDSAHVSVSGYVYDSTSCYQCHPDGTALGVEHTQFFPIEAGSRHESITCGDCHPDAHDHRVFTCTSCHRHAQSRTDSTHATVSGYRFESPECLRCHPRSEVVSREQHAAYFPILTGAHAPFACGDCHDRPGDYRSFTCLSCHDHEASRTDSAHAGIPGYEYTSPLCLRCHPDGTQFTREAHAPRFPISRGAAHGILFCGDCHQVPFDYTSYTCISCHRHRQGLSDSTHAGLVAYHYESPACLQCHPASQVITREDHDTFFPIVAGDHAPFNCNDCHDLLGDYRRFTCISCHDHGADPMSSAHAAIPGYQYASDACRSCHPRGGTMTLAQHQTLFPISAGAVHAPLTCVDCHTTPLVFSAFSCVSCHDHAQALMDPPHVGLPGYQYSSSACLECHPQGTVMTRAQHEPFFPITTENHNLACGECHNTPRDFKKFECILCHSHLCPQMNPRHTEVGGYSCVSAECYRCHPTGRSEGERGKANK
jgi:hypothetical protein